MTSTAGVPPVAPEPAVSGVTSRRRGWGWLLLVPGMLWLAVFFLFPTVQLVFTSLYDATTFAADSVDRVDVSKVTITDDRGVLTLTFKAH